MSLMKAALAMALCAAAALPATAGVYEDRESDWRNGAVVYQVIVDRFAPSAKLDAKRALYPAPKVLRRWDESPQRNEQVAPGTQITRHELDFWGGDLQSLRGKLDHVQGLGADVLYLNPIHLGFTNHKYDSLDFQAVSPEYGTRADVKALAAELKRRRMKLVLDGVFNHMGRNAPAFKQAEAAYLAETAAPGAGRVAAGGSIYRDWFVFGPQFPGGARTWKGVLNLPELNLENPAVRKHIWAAPGSVVRSYLRDGVDGWRLDTAYELGPDMLAQLTQAAHQEKPGSLVVGEIWNHPAGWMPAMDGVMNFHLRSLLLSLVRGDIAPATAAAMLDRLVADVGVEPLLKSWLVLDNHDVKRLADELPDTAQRRLAQVLQFTLPGAPNLYYGVEVGMAGGDDPANRGPMRWDLVEQAHPDLAWTKQLIALHQKHRALRVGDYRAATAGKLLAFERHTDRAADTVLVLANPGDQPVTESVQWRNGAMMDGTTLHDLLPAPAGSARASVYGGFVRITLPPRSVRVLSPDTGPQGGYSVYKRVR
jgi:glycosidase